MSLILQIYFVWKIFLEDGYDFHNAHKDEDKKIDPPCGQLDDNVVLVVELDYLPDS
jgi:hypothetical protein